MKNIKLLKPAMVGRIVQRKGWAGPSEDEEADGLIAAGVAKAHSGPLPDENAAKNAAKDELAAKNAAKDELAAKLDGTVAEVSARLEGMSKADLKTLSKLEAKGSNRVTLIAAIDAAADAAAE